MGWTATSRRSPSRADGKTTASEGHEVLAHPEGTSGTIELVSHRYRSCFFVDKDTRGPQFDGRPFCLTCPSTNLNRFVLVVKVPETPQGQGSRGLGDENVHQGRAAKCFNLAPSSLDNPFREPFRKVQRPCPQKGASRRSSFTFQTGPCGHRNTSAKRATRTSKPRPRRSVQTRRQTQRAGQDREGSGRVPVKHTITIEEVISNPRESCKA
jgi:hypothetical protein